MQVCDHFRCHNRGGRPKWVPKHLGRPSTTTQPAVASVTPLIPAYGFSVVISVTPLSTEATAVSQSPMALPIAYEHTVIPSCSVAPIYM